MKGFTGHETATQVYHDNGRTVCRYHSTPVVVATGTQVSLHSGGWRTATTKKHMNQCAVSWGLDFHVYQKNHEWFVAVGGKVLEFTDGMVFETTDLCPTMRASQ